MRRKKEVFSAKTGTGASSEVGRVKLIGLAQPVMAKLALSYGGSPSITIYLQGKRTVLELSGLGKGFSYNGNTTVYTDETVNINNAVVNDVVLPPIQVTDSGDAIYFGSAEPFKDIKVNVGTAGVYSDITLEWQYWNGTAWVALAGISDGTSGFTVVGKNKVSYTLPIDWAKNTINEVECYWIRCVSTKGTTPVITTAPLATQAWIKPVEWLDIVGATYTVGTPKYLHAGSQKRYRKYRLNITANTDVTVDKGYIGIGRVED